MEPVVEAPDQIELQLLTDWGDPDARRRHRIAAAGAVTINIALILILGVLPQEWFNPPEVLPVAERVTPLFLPPELTQRAPNHGKVTNQFEVQGSSNPQRGIRAPIPSPPTHIQMPKKGDWAAIPEPDKNTVPPAAPPPLPEPPKVETPQAGTPDGRAAQSTATAPPPPPQIQTQEKPKLTFESVQPAPRGVPPDQRVIPLPGGTSVRELTHDALTGAGAGTPQGTIIGDQSLFSGQISAPGSPKAGFQLKSDPMGVDFAPYLSALLMTLRRNWVIPESVQYTRRGVVGVQLAISKTGALEKVVIVQPSGSLALDRSAVAALSASEPLPALPLEFKGARIALQLNFGYH